MTFEEFKVTVEPLMISIGLPVFQSSNYAGIFVCSSHITGNDNLVIRYYTSGCPVWQVQYKNEFDWSASDPVEMLSRFVSRVIMDIYEEYRVFSCMFSGIRRRSS